MTHAVDRLIFKKTGVNPNLSESHIRCICNKIALIHNKGLKAIQLSSKSLVSLNKNTSTLGFVPNLTPIMEESKELEPSEEFVAEDVILEEENCEEEVESSNGRNKVEERPEDPATSKNWVDEILKKRIPCSAAKRSEYHMCCQKLDYDGPSLIAGYGIHCNIKFQSRDCGYKACKIIGRLLENERDQQERKGGKNYYNKVEISQEDWDVVNKLNDMLSEFYFVTKKMEGDNSSACLMLSEYCYIKDFIKEKMKSTTSTEPEFPKMLQAMASKTNTYLNEALSCNAILVATALNPSFRLLIFKTLSPSHYQYTLDLLNQLFNNCKAQYDFSRGIKELSCPEQRINQGSKHAIVEVDYFPNEVASAAPLDDELTIYLEV
ncbi:hypothetical protein PCASD_09567 [Puccinia coronata f. sp. avenae]|uniref:hAT-like transposase RNase-H fold domain-containing protein n=1 Tax=Puccinia coronata f. sp. avenae TaxID=200324 RepID=A0A2N5V2D2_9BASI|nr:hypothetical protein PCASD_09567 [Puccinia coronata f. sp. avenae]